MTVNKRSRTSSNVHENRRFYAIFQTKHAAHNGLVGGLHLRDWPEISEPAVQRRIDRTNVVATIGDYLESNSMAASSLASMAGMLTAIA